MGLSSKWTGHTASTRAIQVRLLMGLPVLTLSSNRTGLRFPKSEITVRARVGSPILTPSRGSLYENGVIGYNALLKSVRESTMRNVLLAAVLMLFSCFAAHAQTPIENLSKATLAVYQGQQVCAVTTVPGFFGEPEEVYGCKFVSHFTCTATVVANQGRKYEALTAGHCFDWDKKDNYYVSETVSKTPVLKHVVIEKFENDERYDFGLVVFESIHEYPTVPVDTVGLPIVVGESIHNENFAYGLTKQSIDGKVVSSNIIDPSRQSMDEIKGRYLVNVGVGPGASGSAIVNKDGKIIGLVEAIFPGTQMPTVVIPTGKTFMNFLEDDSAGIEPKKQVIVKKLPEDDSSSIVKFFKWLWHYKIELRVT